MKTLCKLFILLFALFFFRETGYAQKEEKRTAEFKGLSGVTKNVIIGYAYSDFMVDPKADVKTNFQRIGFSPTMIWMLGEKLFFESQVEFFTDSGKVATQVEYAKLSYILNKYVTIGMGKILTPFGTYTERVEAPFIERMPNAPLGFKHTDGLPSIGPTGSEMGLDVRGGFQVGNAKMNYVVYLSNGARLNDGIKEPELAGAVDYENYFDNNTNKAIGMRLGLLPLSNSSLEVGASMQFSKAGDAKSVYEEVMARAYGADISYHRVIRPLKTLINVKGQMNYLMLDKAMYKDDQGETYTFDNKSSVVYLMLSLRPVLLHNNIMKRLELQGRYNRQDMARDARWGGLTTRMDAGLSYWLSLRTGFRVAYEKLNFPGGGSHEVYLMRFVTGF